MIDRQLLIEAHRCLEVASELLRKDMLYLSTVKEARTKLEQGRNNLLKLEEQLSPKVNAQPIAVGKEVEVGG